LPDRVKEARQEIARAVDYAAAAGVEAVHVMASRTDGSPESEACFRDNLLHACDLAAVHSLNVLIKPINTRDVKGYHLSTTAHAEQIINDLARPELKIIYDCCHMQIMHGDLTRTLEKLLPNIGHIQIAAVPDRGEPDRGEIDYRWLLGHLSAYGYQGHIRAEYRPRSNTEVGLGWMTQIKVLWTTSPSTSSSRSLHGN
jgi:hydroxypyruvate isomerase